MDLWWIFEVVIKLCHSTFREQNEQTEGVLCELLLNCQLGWKSHQTVTYLGIGMSLPRVAVHKGSVFPTSCPCLGLAFSPLIVTQCLARSVFFLSKIVIIWLFKEDF